MATILHTSLHQIDHHTNLLRPINIDNGSPDLTNYINRLISEITGGISPRQFQFASDSTETRTAISHFLTGDYSEGTNINSNRLLRIESEAQQRVSHLEINIQKGSLFQAVIQDDNDHIVVITKADHNQFLDEADLILKNGLPFEKRIFKAFLARFNGTDFTQILVYDTTSRMAKYWWSDYLELTEKYTDEYNTEKSLDILDKKLFNPMKSKHPSDRTILRNSTIGFFRNNAEFNLETYIETTFTNYAPVDPAFPIASYIEKIRRLPETGKFDSRFGIIQEKIGKRQYDRIILTTQLELVIKEPVANLSSLIVAEKDAEGNKFIKIRTDNGFDRFKGRDQ